ncbi:phospholipid phosphatase 1 isoform X3 [Mirounga leonina]|uniref:phospholipid phosphatase 1 isoform X3 n=1 Tax=Mirounga leonina TaxID=9715 RepID=UPI00156C2CCE|nr:phospholipid phosphatase 1 isoform X3 [Mirounga leonina]
MFDKTRLPYVALDVLCVLLASMPMAVLSLSQINPFQRGFFCKDNSIQYPYHDSTITSTVLSIVGLGLPISSMIIGEALSVYYNLLHSNSFIRNNYIATIYKAIGTFLFGAAASQSLTDIAKYSIGRLRPHFLDVCDPDWSKINCSVGYIENYICRGNAHKVKEGRLSFYSGHSSFSMYCMLFVAVSTQRPFPGGEVLRAAVQLTCSASVSPPRAATSGILVSSASAAQKGRPCFCRRPLRCGGGPARRAGPLAERAATWAPSGQWGALPRALAVSCQGRNLTSKLPAWRSEAGDVRPRFGTGFLRRTNSLCVSTAGPCSGEPGRGGHCWATA